MEITRKNYTSAYKFISRIWDSSLIGKGTLSRFLSKLLIPTPKGQLINKTIYDFDLLINPVIDNGVEHSLYYFGTYEKGTLNFIKTQLSAGDVFFDIGANIGLMSIFASYVIGQNGKVISFEANPETAQILRYNIDLNNLKNIVIVDKAVGNKEGKIKIYNNWAVNRGGATLIKPKTESTSFEVDLIKIDAKDEYQNMKIDLIKIDVEGFEMDVLRGIEKILQREKPPKLIIECSADRDNNYDSVFEIHDFVKKANTYKIYKLSKSKERLGQLIEVTNKADLPKHDNIFCIKH